MTRYTVFTSVDTFYRNLLDTLTTAKNDISMLYFTFDDGTWARQIADVLGARVSAGVNVRLMVDGLGVAVDNPRNVFANQVLLNDLRAMGVQVDVFQPHGHRLGFDNRLHTKICAIDEHAAFIGGSNIGDYYTQWDDTNLRMDGELGRSLHEVYDFIRCHTRDGACEQLPAVHLSKLFSGKARIWLTVPRQRRDIRRELLRIILDAETDIYIRNWYFLPDREILDALRSQAERGVRVHVLLSHRTKVRPIDFANLIHGHKLARSGGRVLRYTGGYMHAKVAWNDEGHVLFGSANMDKKALRDNFECSLTLTSTELTEDLTAAFEADAAHSILQDRDHFRKGSLLVKAAAYTCNLASAWL